MENMSGADQKNPQPSKRFGNEKQNPHTPFLKTSEYSSDKTLLVFYSLLSVFLVDNWKCLLLLLLLSRGAVLGAALTNQIYYFPFPFLLSFKYSSSFQPKYSGKDHYDSEIIEMLSLYSLWLFKLSFL